MRPTLKFARKYRSLLFLAVILVVAVFSNPHFMTIENILNVLMQIPVNGIVAVGMTLVIITGGFDLSVGSIMAMAGVIVMKVLHLGIVPAILAGLTVGVVVGIFNGGLIAYVGINPFIVTLGSMALVRGLALGITDARPISVLDMSFLNLGSSYFPAVFLLVLIIATEYFICQTRAGHNIFIFGSNKEAGYVAGVNMKKTQFTAYFLCSAFASIAGVFLAARLGTGSPVIAEDAALLAIAAVILGGTSLSGGSGSIVQTLIGILILAVLTNVLNLMSITSYVQMVVKGILVVAVVALDAPGLKKTGKRTARTPAV